MKKVIPMKNEDAIALVDDLLRYFEVTMYIRPPRITKGIICPTEEKCFFERYIEFTTSKDSSKMILESLRLEKYSVKAGCEEMVPSFTTFIQEGNRKFEVSIFETLDELGFASELDYAEPDEVEDEPYENVPNRLYNCYFCDITEYHPNGKIKYNMAFSFNLVTMEFVELFCLDYTNKNDIVRTANVYEVEPKFKSADLSLELE